MTELSQTKLKVRIQRKTNPEVVELLRLARKNKAWAHLVKIISGPTRLYSSINLEQIDRKTSAGDTVVIPGKVLSAGNLTNKIRICALSISKSAMHKLKETKSEYCTIAHEIKINPKAAGIKILR
jgi:large subunit ribosomal protein L18e